MLWIHFKCSQIVIADKDPSTFNQSSQCSQHVITSPRYPCPQCLSLLPFVVARLIVSGSKHGETSRRFLLTLVLVKDAFEYVIELDVVRLEGGQEVVPDGVEGGEGI